ncbi:hypothetical protein QQ045_015840 [Rhodiola kirilowii]
MGVERELSESDVDSSGSEDEVDLNGGEKLFMQSDLGSYVLQRKSVFRCRLCPKITCLSEETMKVHLESKRHTRAEKQMKEGRLRFMLNSDGEVEEEAETHAERHARVLASTQGEGKKKNRSKGRQRQRMRKKRKEAMKTVDKVKQETESQPKKKRKTENKGRKCSNDNKRIISQAT